MARTWTRVQLTTTLACFQHCALADESSAGPQRIELLAVLLPISLLIAGLLTVWFFVKRMGPINRNSAGPLAVEQVVAVGTRERVVVLRDGERCFAVGVTANSVSFLSEVSAQSAEHRPTSS